MDRRALPEPTPATGASEFAPPRTSLEAEIASIWGAVLGIGRVGAHDDFFQLGGHSLAAMRVAARLALRFGVAVPARALFEHPSVAELTVVVGRLAGKR